MYHLALFLHVLAATIWTGGHLVLLTAVLPRALAARDPEILLAFESRFEKIGMPALIMQVATGLYMAHTLVPEIAQWVAFGSPLAGLIGLKLSLLTITVLAAVDARLRIIPTLSAATLPVMARRIALVTAVSVLFVLVGVSFRGGLLQALFW